MWRGEVLTVNLILQRGWSVVHCRERQQLAHLGSLYSITAITTTMLAGKLLRVSVMLSLVAFFPNSGQQISYDDDCSEEPYPATWMRATPHNGTSFTVTWGSSQVNPARCLQGYRMCLHQPTGHYDCVFISCDSLGGCSTSNTWFSAGSGLSTVECAKFTVTVASVLDVLGVDGRISTPRVVTFLAAPEGVEGLTALETTGNSTHLQWQLSSSPCADQYSASWCELKTPTSTVCDTNNVEFLSSNQTTLTITDLRPCTNYRVTITTMSGQKGPKTDATLLVSTPSTGVGAVQNVTTDVHGNQVELDWSIHAKDHKCIAGYEVCWQAEDGNTTCHNSGVSITDLVLEYCDTYNVSIKAIDVSNSTSEPVTVPIRTGAEKVLNLTASDVTARSATLSWTNSPSTTTCGTGYVVEWCAEDDDISCEPSVRQHLPINTTQLVLTGLHPCLPHHVHVFTTSEGGSESGPSRVLIYTTLDELRPPEVTRVDVMSSVLTKVEFSAPKDSGQCVSNYTGCFWEEGKEAGAAPVCLPAPNTRYWTNWDNHTKPCTRYTLVLTVYSNDGKSNSTSLNFTSGANSVEGLRASYVTTGLSPVFVKLTWTLPQHNECVQQHQIMWVSVDGKYTVGNATAPGEATEFILPELEPCTQYVASVVQRTPYPSIATSITIFSADNLTVVSDVNVSCLGKDRDPVVHFMPPVSTSSCDTSYLVCSGQYNDSRNWTCQGVTGPGELQVSLADLDTSRECGVRISTLAYDNIVYTTDTVGFTCAAGHVAVPAANTAVLLLLLATLHKIVVLLF